jgi:tight adherence protein C
MILTARRNERIEVRARLGLPSGAPGSAITSIGRVARPFAARITSGSVRSLDDESLGRRLVLAAIGAVVGARMLPGSPIGRALLGAFGAVALAGYLERRDRDRSPEVVLAMPDVLDRVAMCVLAGRSVEHALRIVARDAAGPIGDAVRASVASLDAGASRREAFDALVRGPAGNAWAGPVAAMERAERLGVPVADVLVAQATDLRQQARAIVEAQVRAAPIKLVFPLVFCFLPAFIVLAVGPVAVSAIRTLTSL